MTAPTKTESFRLYLMREEMTLLQEYLQIGLTSGEIRQGEGLYRVLQKITKLILLANANVLTAAYVSTGTARRAGGNVGLKAGLGLDVAVSATQRMSQAYHKWVNLPGLCTPEEIELAQDHRYTEGLMTPEEREQYDANIMSKFNF